MRLSLPRIGDQRPHCPGRCFAQRRALRAPPGTMRLALRFHPNHHRDSEARRPVPRSSGQQLDCRPLPAPDSGSPGLPRPRRSRATLAQWHSGYCEFSIVKSPTPTDMGFIRTCNDSRRLGGRTQACEAWQAREQGGSVLTSAWTRSRRQNMLDLQDVSVG